MSAIGGTRARPWPRSHLGNWDKNSPVLGREVKIHWPVEVALVIDTGMKPATTFVSRHHRSGRQFYGPQSANLANR